jgi:hypothetical protein
VTVEIPRSLWPDLENMIFSLGFPYPSSVEGTPDGLTSIVTWTGLTPEQSVLVPDLVAAVKAGMSLALYQSVKPEVPIQRAYVQLASPTAAQRLAWERSVVRVLRAILRD